MELIIGGAFQGKSTYAKETHPEICWEEGDKISREQLMKAGGVLNFQEFIRKELKEDQDLSMLAQELAEKNPDMVIVSQEVGYGVVPMDAFDRKYRETVGRICTSLAGKSKKVVRVVCGIGTVIKDA